MTDINEQVAVKLYNYLGNPHLTWATCNVRGQYRMIAKEIDSLYTPLIEQARQEGRRQVFEEHAAGKYAKAQLLKAQQHYREKLNEAFSKGYQLACDQLSKHYRKQIEEIFREIEGFIIGVDGCKFEERLDEDKGCLVLDMNQNQFNEMKSRFMEEK